MRARMALSQSQIQYQHREILLKDKPSSLFKYSAKATVPVLIVNRVVLEESLDIMIWALDIYDSENWLMKDNIIKNNEIFNLITTCDTKFKPQLDHYKYSDRHEHSEAYYREKTLWFFSLLNSKLCEHKYLISNQLSLADIAIFPFVRQYAFVNKNWFDLNIPKEVRVWLELLIESPLFLQIMQKKTLWSDDLKPTNPSP